MHRATLFLALVFAVTASIAAALAGQSNTTTAAASAPTDSRSSPAASPSGKALFEQLWSVAPSAFGRWGRGPTSNGETCGDCHVDAGRDRPPADSHEPLRQGVVRLSIDGANGAQPHPAYGSQLQTEGVLGSVPGEGEAFIDWIEHVEHFADGDAIRLRKPVLRFERLAFGALGSGSMTSLRLAPSLRGVAWFDAVPAQALARIAEEQREAGVHGRLNRLAANDAAAIGRFGLKSNQPSLVSQIASALHEDLGVTSPLFEQENCPPAQRACAAQVMSRQPEIDRAELDALAAYLRELPLPAARPISPETLRLGQALFADSGCAHCHRPHLPVHSDLRLDLTEIAAYTDLLIHDLGAGLADGRPDGEASGRDWRTAPLWGLSNAENSGALLHDGRARDIAEAILWHAGEALSAREMFRSMRKSDRELLLAFLRSL